MKLKIQPEGYGATPQAIQYWTQNRNKISDLYPSEKYFLLDALKNSQSVLDIGCAAGGSAHFTKEINSTIQYYGIDISLPMIEVAKQNCGSIANCQFLHFDGKHIPLADNAVDFCFSFGVFHHVPNWQALTAEACRVSRKYILFDLRVWEQESIINSEKSFQKLAVGQSWDGTSIIPYNLLSMTDLKQALSEYQKLDMSCRVYGYSRQPTELAVTPAKEVLMASVFLEKNPKSATINFEIK